MCFICLLSVEWKILELAKITTHLRSRKFMTERFALCSVSKILICLTYCYRASYHTLGLRWHHLTYSRHILWLIKTIHISSWWILAWVEQLAQYQWPWHIPLILFEGGCNFQGSMDILIITTCSIALLGLSRKRVPLHYTKVTSLACLR